MKIVQNMKSNFLVVNLLALCLVINAQEKSTKHFIGINPSVTAEPFYEKGEVDINIFPVVYQRIITERFDIRFTSNLSLAIRNEGNSSSIYGFEVGAPFFFSQKVRKNQPSKGLFIAPIFSFVQYSKEDHSNMGIWLEPGYNVLMDKNFSVSIGLQVGGTYFFYKNDENKWREHIGLKVILGKWF